MSDGAYEADSRTRSIPVVMLRVGYYWVAMNQMPGDI
jgi:hypothetical protein